MICTKHLQVEDSGRKYKPQVLDDAQTWQTIDASALTDDSPFNTEKRRLTRKLGNQINTALLFKLLLYMIKIGLFIGLKKFLQPENANVL